MNIIKLSFIWVLMSPYSIELLFFRGCSQDRTKLCTGCETKDIDSRRNQSPCFDLSAGMIDPYAKGYD